MLSRLPPSILLALTQVVGEGSAFLRNLILARLIGAEDMGLAVALAVGIRIFEMIGDFGLERWLVQVSADGLDRARGTVHLLQLIKACLLAALAIAVATPLVNVLQPQLDPNIFALAALSIVIRGLVNCDYRERQRNRDYVGTLQVEGGSNLLALIAIAPVALVTQDYSAMAWASIAQAASLCVLSHAVASRTISFEADAATARQALRFGLPVACNAVLMFFAMQGDRLLVAAYFEPRALAAFAIAAQLTLLPALAGARFLLAFDLPRFSAAVRSGGEWESVFRTRLLQVVSVAAALVAVLVAFGNEVIGFLYGADFVGATIIVGLLALGAGIRLLRAVPNTLLMAMGRTSLLLVGNLPRILALFVALWALENGAGLVTVILVGVISEAAGLCIGLAAIYSAGRWQLPLTQQPVGTSS